MKTLKTLVVLLLLTMLMTSCTDPTEDLELQEGLKIEIVNSKLMKTGFGSENNGTDRE